MAETQKLRVFLCHASQDKPVVRELFQRLHAEGWIDPWLDEEKLLPGQDWDLEIYKATRDADAIIICLSSTSVAKEGYVNKEIRRALDIAGEKPEGAIYVIPLRLDNCDPSFVQLRRWHWADYFTPNAHEKLLQSLRMRAEVLKIQISTNTTESSQFDVPPSALRHEPKAKGSPVATAAPDLDLYIPPEYAGADFFPPPVSVPTWTFGGIEFVKIPHGEFLMGSTDKDTNAYDDEKPQHKLTIPYDFLMARFQVTNDLFRSFVKRTSYKTKAEQDGAAWAWNGEIWVETKGANWLHPRGPDSEITGLENHPVVQVIWKDGQAFCDWLNREYGGALPRGLVFRLPTEAEWEKAARGVDGRIFPWGNDFDARHCNSSEGGPGRTTPVGLYSPQGDSPFGCADMSGNVWEWTASLWGKDAGKPSYGYPYSPRDGRENQKAADDVRRILRGGSFNNFVRYVCAAVRNTSFSAFGDYSFRVALAPLLS